MEEWELKERHFTEVDEALRKAGCYSPKGIIRRWNGTQVYKELKIRGHSSPSYENCKCHQSK